MKWSEVKWSEVKWSVAKGENETLWEKFKWVLKWWEVKCWGESVIKLCVGGKKILETMYSTFLPWIVYLLYMLYFKLSCVYCCSCLACIVVILCVLLYYVRIAVFTFDAGLLARSQYSEGLATGHLDTGFSWFPCVYKQMLRWFPRFQVATTYFSCSFPT